MSDRNENFSECGKKKTSIDSVHLSTRREYKKRGGGGETMKARNVKENQANNFANINKDGVSNNWKTFKQNLLHLEKTSPLQVENKREHGLNKKKSVDIGKVTSQSSADGHVKKKFTDLSKEKTKVIALDCEMVGIDTGKDNMLARVSLVNKYGNCIYDKYVLPSEPIVDYRTRVSGIRPNDLHNGERFETVQKEVAEILQGRILVGHALRNDLKVLFLSHPRRAIRDTSRYKPFRKFANGRTPSLRKLAEEVLGVKIQQGEHDSVVDARTALQLYLLYRKEWEKGIHSKSNV
ncbi:RNA exonuclease 4 [Zootermopsis nevadensis]|uniref:RNA exonuclease 4 n=1 Tax=Zootermopsis nevadensis TaxID=136037 RepID=A0A067RCL8_ZOONE|nr:RNA exonuclease 4 [Zootermopsis nevadensis]KDR17651.1 RNA exonuclease 4 [Zootermopsis nevadensis]